MKFRTIAFCTAVALYSYSYSMEQDNRDRLLQTYNINKNCVDNIPKKIDTRPLQEVFLGEEGKNLHGEITTQWAMNGILNGRAAETVIACARKAISDQRGDKYVATIVKKLKKEQLTSIKMRRLKELFPSLQSKVAKQFLNTTELKKLVEDGVWGLLITQIPTCFQIAQKETKNEEDPLCATEEIYKKTQHIFYSINCGKFGVIPPKKSRNSFKKRNSLKKLLTKVKRKLQKKPSKKERELEELDNLYHAYKTFHDQPIDKPTIPISMFPLFQELSGENRNIIEKPWINKNGKRILKIETADLLKSLILEAFFHLHGNSCPYSEKETKQFIAKKLPICFALAQQKINGESGIAAIEKIYAMTQDILYYTNADRFAKISNSKQEATIHSSKIEKPAKEEVIIPLPEHTKN